MAQRFKIANEILDVCQRLYRKGFVSATDGNVSAKIDDTQILCTPSGRNKGELTQDDLVVIGMDGSVSKSSRRRPSTEMQMHLQYYQSRPDVHSVVHAHAPYCTGFATAGLDLTGCVLPEIVVSLGTIPLASYATPSTSEVPDSIAKYVANHNAILLQNHGVVTAGKSPLEAYYILEKTEHAAKILFISRMLGGENRLTASQVDQLHTIAGSSYGINVAKTPACVPAQQPTQERKFVSPENNLEVKDSILRAIKDLGL